MTTLLTALGYLWLVITILLVALWFLRRSDLSRQPDRFDDGVPADRLTDPPITNPADGSSVGSAPGPPEPPPTADTADADRTNVNTNGVNSDGANDTNGTVTAVAPPTVLELLDGADLPYDLTPLTATVSDHDRHVIFLTSHPDPEQVGTAFADELTKLGYEIEPKGLDEALARRGDDVLSLRISPEASSVDDGGEPRYPTAGETDVAIEVWTSNGPPPPLAR